MGMAALVTLTAVLLATCAQSLRPLVDTVALSHSAPIVGAKDEALPRDKATASKDQRGSRPIIGILTQPGDVAEKRGESYFSAGYVKWIEGAGARVVPILYDLDIKGLDKMFSMVNGILIPGGNYPLSTDTRWFRAAEHLFNRAVAANKQGDHFPIHGTCLGFELLATLLTRDENALVKLDAHNHPAPLEFTRGSASSSWLSGIPASVLHDLATSPIAMHNHHYGLLPDAFKDFPALGNFFNVLSHSRDRNGVKYVSMIEARDHPFTGIAFHPEKVLYEWTTEIDIPHTRMASDMAYALAQAFVSEARRNSHSGADIVDEDKHMIYNFQPIFYGKHQTVDEDLSFEQVYLFKDEWQPGTDAPL